MLGTGDLVQRHRYHGGVEELLEPVNLRTGQSAISQDNQAFLQEVIQLEDNGATELKRFEEKDAGSRTKKEGYF